MVVKAVAPTSDFSLNLGGLALATAGAPLARHAATTRPNVSTARTAAATAVIPGPPIDEACCDALSSQGEMSSLRAISPG